MIIISSFKGKWYRRKRNNSDMEIFTSILTGVGAILEGKDLLQEGSNSANKLFPENSAPIFKSYQIQDMQGPVYKSCLPFQNLSDATI